MTSRVSLGLRTSTFGPKAGLAHEVFLYRARPATETPLEAGRVCERLGHLRRNTKQITPHANAASEPPHCTSLVFGFLHARIDVISYVRWSGGATSPARLT
jgi:hypothetical protein